MLTADVISFPNRLFSLTGDSTCKLDFRTILINIKGSYESAHGWMFLVPQFQNESLCATEFDLRENEPVGRSHMNGFALRLVLTRGQKTTREWPN